MSSTSLESFLYKNLFRPDTTDIVGVGKSQFEEENRWFYEIVEGLGQFSEVEPYWLGRSTPSVEYDIEGDIFDYQFNGDMPADSTVLIVPKPSIYRSEKICDDIIEKYEAIADIPDKELQAVLMTNIGADLENSAVNGMGGAEEMSAIVDRYTNNHIRFLESETRGEMILSRSDYLF